MDADVDRSDRMNGTFHAVQSLLLTVEDVETFLQELAVLASRQATGPASCGITVRNDGRPVTVASSDALASRLDESQYDSGGGPCLQALATGETVLVPDMADEHRWPAYVERAAGLGLRSSLSLPLVVDNVTVGALNLYSTERTNAFGGENRLRGETFAAQASTALILTMRQAQRSATAAQLEEALSSRSVVDQALGILMGQQRCSAEEAFALLRTHSQNNNRKLREVAADLVESTTGSPFHDRLSLPRRQALRPAGDRAPPSDRGVGSAEVG